MPQELADKIQAAEREENFDVFPENHDAVRIFIAMLSQWDVGRMIYSSLFSVMDLFEIEDKKDCFSRVQHMEFYVISNQK